MPQGRPMGAAFRAREFRRSASLIWECEGFETDNLARQPAGMRRAATLPHVTTNTRRNHDAQTKRFGRTNPRVPKARFGRMNPRSTEALPEPSDSNYDACQWIAGDMISAFLENGLVREKSYVW
jgi:hypothetical protein